MQANTSLMALTVAASATVAAHRFVTIAGAQATAGVNAVGVSRFAAVTAELMAVDAIGTALVEAGAAVTKGAALEADANGRAITRSTGVALGRALSAAAAAGDLIEVLLIQN